MLHGLTDSIMEYYLNLKNIVEDKKRKMQFSETVP